VRLALIRLEVKRQLSISLAHAGVRSRRCWESETDKKQEQQKSAAKRDQCVLEHGYLLFIRYRKAS
jgi:ribosomal protein S21